MASERDRRLRQIAEEFQRKMRAAGMELTGVSAEGTPTISVWLHGDECPAKRNADATCTCERPDTEGEQDG